MQCNQCQHENIPGFKFCATCGNPIDPCPICGRTHEVTVYCPYKGTSVTQWKADQERAKECKEAEKTYREFCGRWAMIKEQADLWLMISFLIGAVIFFLDVLIIGPVSRVDDLLYQYRMYGYYKIVPVLLTLSMIYCCIRIWFNSRYKKRFINEFPENAKLIFWMIRWK